MLKINVYAGGRLDRAAHRRDDAAWLDSLRRAPEARLVPVWRGRNLVLPGEAPRAAFLAVDAHLDACAACTDDLVLLGLIGEVAHFAVDVSHLEEAALADHGRFEDLRAIGLNMAPDEGNLLAYARGITWWHARHRFCGVCGAPTASVSAGHSRKCTNPDCGAPHFPRTDPAIIVLVHDGDRALLARQPQWPKGQHSVLAGFVEPGESLEAAVAREVYEEVGLTVEDIEYHSSQPWPFPSSLMLGYTARAVTTDITLHDDELESARWFSRAEVADCPFDDRFRLPRPDSISRRLIADWLATGR